MLGIAVIFAVLNSILGITAARYLDVSLAGMIAVVTGITTFITFLFSPLKGWIKQKKDFNQQKENFNHWLKLNN